MSAQPVEAPYGAWKSPITPAQIYASAVSLGAPTVVDGAIIWAEMRPNEGGRITLVRRAADGTRTAILPAPYNARTRVHEYGGGATLLDGDTLYFVNFVDQRLYRLAPGGDPEALTPDVATRYADMRLDAGRRRLIAVREDHRGDGEAVNSIVAISLDGDDAGTVLVAGYDFFSAPRLSPDGTQLAWLSWNHPNMPWDGTELWVAPVAADGALGSPSRVAGGVDESVFQPAWSPDGILHFVSDPDGWWNLYRLRDGQVEPLYRMTAEFGRPLWAFGMRTYTFIDAQRLLCVYIEQGTDRLGVINTALGTLEALETPFTSIYGPAIYEEDYLFLAGSPTAGTALVRFNPITSAHEVLARQSDTEVDPGYLSPARTIEFPSAGGRTAHAFYYPPVNKDYRPPAGSRPPLLVFSHGGPTGATAAVLKLNIQFWTSRGFAVVDVNYGGSTGYGRAYRNLLRGNWGIVDVEDCVAAGRFLVDQGLADPERVAIRGGSAGGFTTLAALVFDDFFKAGASYFGVSDLGALARDTHKFESRYLDRMVGPYPERADLYDARSPIKHVEQLACPVIFFQGLEDKVVPPNQSEAMYRALLHKEIPTAYVPYEGEQHGFRQARNLRHALENELYFYARVFGIDLPEGSVVEPVSIENLD